MNASDIVNAKQNKTLFGAYRSSFLTASTVLSSINPMSSINGRGGITSYYSTLRTVNTSNCFSTFQTYELERDLQAGQSLCGVCIPSQLQWKYLTSTTMTFYSTTYSSLSTPSTFTSTTTTILTAPPVVICPLISFYQGNKTC
uniref:Uncharacterized protein n=1 Tax=viral metagenome TaxID=1070528 RepID=A0A6C0KUC6_9ZZZZ